jgi:ribosomal protein S18 acetylase RimI-like enzyme
MNINYIELTKNEINLIKPLWENLKVYHHELSPHFPERYMQFTFEERKEEILKKAGNGTLKMDIVKDEDTMQYIGYCISSISKENIGEVDSIYLNEKYQSLGIGTPLMKRALNWMDEKNVKSKKIVVAVGNEELLSFYEKFDFLPRHIILEQK